MKTTMKNLFAVLAWMMVSLNMVHATTCLGWVNLLGVEADINLSTADNNVKIAALGGKMIMNSQEELAKTARSIKHLADLAKAQCAAEATLK